MEQIVILAEIICAPEYNNQHSKGDERDYHQNLNIP